MQMAVQDAVTQIGADVKASVDEAAVAFDGLVDELKLAAPNANTVLSLSGQIWVASLKAWANLVLAPAKIAAGITDES
jgi:hypothetical protein